MAVAEFPAYCDMLIDEGILTKEQVYEGIMAQQEHGGHLLESLVGLGHIKPEEFDAIIACSTDVAVLDLNQCSIQNDTLAIMPESLAVKHHVFPIDKLGPLLTLGMAIPNDFEAIEEIENITGLRVKPVYSKHTDIDQAMRDHYNREPLASEEA